jgi:VWFA-related protein
MMIKSPFFLLLIALLILVYPVYLVPQQKKKIPELQHDASVTLKLVQVYVTDREGRLIKDLKISDFILYDNDIKQIITDFEKHILEEEPREAKKIKPVPSERSVSRMNRKFFILIDLDRIQFRNIKRAKETLFHFLDTNLKSTDEIGLFTVSNIGGLILRQHLTTEQSEVKEFITSFKDVGSPGASGSRGGVSFVDEAIGSYSINPTGKEGQVRVIRSGIGGGIRHFLDNMKKFAQVLQHVPGNKYILFFSEGYGSSFARNSFFKSVFIKIAQILANSGTTVFSINSDPGHDNIGSRMWADSALEYLSQATGGQHFNDIRKNKDISEKIQKLTGNYYVLGYYIPEIWDGKFHKIDVKVKREGCQIFTHAGYNNPLPFKRLSKTEKFFHLIDLALREDEYSDKMMDFPLLTMSCDLKGQSHAALFAEVHLDQMTKVIEEKVEVFTLIFDKESTIVDSVRTEMDLKSAKAKATYFCTGTPLLPGSYECRIIIRNLETGASAVASSSVTVPALEEIGFQILPPLLLKQEREAFYMPGYGFKKAEGKEYQFSLSDIFLIDASQYAPYVKKMLPINTEVWASIRCRVPAGMTSEIRLSAALFDKTMLEEIPVPLEAIQKERKNETIVFFVKLRIPEIEPDEYTFIFNAEHEKSGAASQVICDFFFEGKEKKEPESDFRETTENLRGERR